MGSVVAGTYWQTDCHFDYKTLKLPLTCHQFLEELMRCPHRGYCAYTDKPDVTGRTVLL